MEFRRYASDKTVREHRMNRIVYAKINVPSVRIAAYLTRQSLEELALAEGKAVTASFKATSVHVIPRGTLMPA